MKLALIADGYSYVFCEVYLTSVLNIEVLTRFYN